MKILRIIHSLNRRQGGIVTYVTESNQVLIERGHAVDVVCLDSPLLDVLQSCPGTIHALGKGYGTYAFHPKLGAWLKAHVKLYDAVIVEGLWQYLGLAARSACLEAGVPYYVCPHGMLDPWFKQKYPLKHLKKLIYWHLFEKHVLKDARAVIFTTLEESQLARRSFGDATWNGVLVRLGIRKAVVDAAPHQKLFLEHYPECKDKDILLFLGRIHPKKGIDLLLQAWRSMSHVSSKQLVIVGPCHHPSYLSRLKASADPSVLWIPMLDGALKWGAYASSSAFILPSHQENFGMAVIESLSMGTPVLISDKINIWREIHNAGAGTVAPDTLSGVCSLLKEWLSWDQARLPQRREAALQAFQKHFDIEQSTDELLKVLELGGQSAS